MAPCATKDTVGWVIGGGEVSEPVLPSEHADGGLSEDRGANARHGLLVDPLLDPEIRL